MANRPRGERQRKRFTVEQVEAIRSYLLGYYYGAVKARDYAKRAMAIDPDGKYAAEYSYHCTYIRVCTQLLKNTGWRPGDEAVSEPLNAS
jgi:hypothetical protein